MVRNQTILSNVTIVESMHQGTDKIKNSSDFSNDTLDPMSLRTFKVSLEEGSLPEFLSPICDENLKFRSNCKPDSARNLIQDSF